eukprot:g11496.t1
MFRLFLYLFAGPGPGRDSGFDVAVALPAQASARPSRAPAPATTAFATPRPSILDTNYDCDPIVSPEMPTRRERGFAFLAHKFADHAGGQFFPSYKNPSKWLLENISFVAADVETALEGGTVVGEKANTSCKAAVITALAMKALLELLQSGLSQGRIPQDDTPVYVLDAMLGNELIQWVPNPAARVKKNQPARVPEGSSHLLLSSSYPVYRLLHALLVLYPETGSTRMGHCKMHHDESIPMHKRVDWDAFQEQLNRATVLGIEGKGTLEMDVDDDPAVLSSLGRTLGDKRSQLEVHLDARRAAAENKEEVDPVAAAKAKFALYTEDTPQPDANLHLETLPPEMLAELGSKKGPMMLVADSADMIFQAWRTDQYKAGCHLAVISAYILHAFWYARSDRQAWLQRFLTAVTSVHAVHAPIADSVKADVWPVYLLWDMLQRFRRELPDFPARGDGALVDVLHADGSAVDDVGAVERRFRTTYGQHPSLVDRMKLGTLAGSGSHRIKRKGAPSSTPVFVTQAYGWMLQHMRKVVDRFKNQFQINLIVLAADERKSTVVDKAQKMNPRVELEAVGGHHIASPCTVEEEENWCLPTYPSLLAKYDALIYFAENATPACWVDLDQVWLRSPEELFDDRYDFIFGSKDQYGVGVSPSFLCVPKVVQPDAFAGNAVDVAAAEEAERKKRLKALKEARSKLPTSAGAAEEVVVDSDGLVVTDSMIVDGNEDTAKRQELAGEKSEDDDSDSDDGDASAANPSSKVPAPPLALQVLLEVRSSLQLNPFGNDLQMWDLIVGREGADDVGGWDYQGRSHQANPDNRTLSYWDEGNLPLPVKGIEYKVLKSSRLASGDGWSVGELGRGLVPGVNSGRLASTRVVELETESETGRSDIISSPQAQLQLLPDFADSLWKKDVRNYAKWFRNSGRGGLQPVSASQSSSKFVTEAAAQIAEAEAREAGPVFPPKELVGFHFYGAVERSDELFELFYCDPSPEVTTTQHDLLRKYAKFQTYSQITAGTAAGGLLADFDEEEEREEQERREGDGDYGEDATLASRGATDDKDADDEEDIDETLQHAAAAKHQASIEEANDGDRNKAQQATTTRYSTRRKKRRKAPSGLSSAASGTTDPSPGLPLALTAATTATAIPPAYYPTAFVHISYADGCCEKAMKKNMELGRPYFRPEHQRAYDRSAFDPQWAADHEHILSVKRGGGLWIWKPYVMLKTLEDDSVPWDAAVVYLDAGNHFIADPRPFVVDALRKSDVVLLQLKCCFEADWSKRETLMALDGDHHAIAERPQMGAYFLAFRKTPYSLRFAREWLSRMIDPVVVKIETML